MKHKKRTIYERNSQIQKPMSISSVNNCYMPSAMPALEPEVPVSGNVPEQNALAQTDVKPLTFEERRQKMKESNMRYNVTPRFSNDLRNRLALHV